MSGYKAEKSSKKTEKISKYKNPFLRLADSSKEEEEENFSTRKKTHKKLQSQTKEGEYRSTKFHFRIGKFKKFTGDETNIDMYINDKKSSYKMYISDSGNAYFKNEVDHLDILNSESSDI